MNLPQLLMGVYVQFLVVTNKAALSIYVLSFIGYRILFSLFKLVRVEGQGHIEDVRLIF
jgi:hypothetical protein